MNFINKLIKRGTFCFVFAFLFFVLLGGTDIKAVSCTIALNDNNEYLVLNTKSGWTDSGVSASCDGLVNKNVSLDVNGTIVTSTNSGANIINNYVKNAGFYKVKYYLTDYPTIQVTRQIRVLPNDLNSSFNTWIGDTNNINTSSNDTFTKMVAVDDGYIVVGNFGNSAYIAKYNLIGKFVWDNVFDALNTDWFFDGVDGYSTGSISSINITDIIKTSGSTMDTDFYISGSYTAASTTTGFVRRIQLAANGGIAEYGKIVSFEMTQINKINIVNNYLVAVGYSYDVESKTNGKIAKSTISGANLVGVEYYTNSLESQYNSFVITSENSQAKIIAVGSSAVENAKGAVGGYITSCSVENFSCSSGTPYYYLTYNQAGTTETYFNDIVSRENGFVIVGRSRIDRVRGQNDSYNTTNTENVIVVSLNSNLGIADVIIKDSSSYDNLNKITKITDTEFMTVGKKNNTGYYARIKTSENGIITITESILSGTSEIKDAYVRIDSNGETNYVLIGDTNSNAINDVGVVNVGGKDAFIAILDKTEFSNFDNVSILQNESICEQESDSKECNGDLVLDKYKLKYGNRLIAYPSTTVISSKNIGDISSYHKFTAFGSLVNFIIGRVIIVTGNDKPDDIEIGEMGIDKWYLYNRNETTVLRNDVWDEYYYPIDDNEEKQEGVTYYVFEFNTATSTGIFKEDTRSIAYTSSNFLKFEDEPHTNVVAFQGEEKAKEYALLQEFGRIKLVNKKYSYSDGVDVLDNRSLFSLQGYYFVYYIDLELEHEENEQCNIDDNGVIRGVCTNTKGYAFVNLKNIKRVLLQVLKQNNYFISEQNVRYVDSMSNKPTSDLYKEEIKTILYTKEMTFNLKENAYLAVEFYESILGDDGYYFNSTPSKTEVHGKTNVTFKKNDADYTKEGKYIVKYCYNYGLSNEVCGETATFVIDRTTPTITYKQVGGGATKVIDYETLERGKSASNPYLMTRDINISEIFDSDPYAYTIVGSQKYYLKCNSDVNDARCLKNLEEYVNIAYEYDKNDPDKVFSITVSDRAGNTMTFYFKIGTQMMEVKVDTPDGEGGNSFDLTVEIYERNNFNGLAVQYVQSESCIQPDCTLVDSSKIASFGDALAMYIKAIIYLNKVETDKVKENPDYVIDESKIIKSIILSVSLSSTLDNQIVGGISIPKIKYENGAYEILAENQTFAISKGLYNFTLFDSFDNESKAVGGIGIDKAKLDIYVSDDSSYNESINNFVCSGGENCDKRVPSMDEEELMQETIFFKAKKPETYAHQDLLPTTLLNDFDKNMLFANKFVYIKFKINNFGIIKISLANSLNVMNNYVDFDTKTENLDCLFVFYGEQVSPPTCGANPSNLYKFSDFKSSSDVKTKLEEKGIYIIAQTGEEGEEFYYLVFTSDGTYHISSELYTEITGVEGAEGSMVTLPVEYSFVIDSKVPNLVASVRCDTTNCKGEKNNFDTADFIYDKSNPNYKIINIGSYSIEFDLETETLMAGIVNRLLVMTKDKETYYNPYTCALGKCDESISELGVKFTSDGRYLKISNSGTYILTFEDASGNSITYAFVIDKEAPVIDEIVDINNKNLNEYQQYVDAKITISENSFLESKTNETIMTIKYRLTSENASAAENAQVNSITVINDEGNCKIGVGSGLVLNNECTLVGNDAKSMRFTFTISINKEKRESGTNTLYVEAIDYFNNTISTAKNFIFDNINPYITYDPSYTPTTKFGEDEFDEYKDLMLSMSANASLDKFSCDATAIIAEKGKINCADYPSLENLKNNVYIEAYEAYRVSYNNYGKEQNGTYTLKENNSYIDANVTLYKKIHTRYSSESSLLNDISNNKKIYTRGQYIQVLIGEQIDPNETYYYDNGTSKVQVTLKEMYRTTNPVCTVANLECELYTMYMDSSKFTNNSYYTIDNDGFTEVSDISSIVSTNYSSYYSEMAAYVEDSGKYIKASTLANSCVKIGNGACENIEEGRIKLISSNVKYYIKAASEYSISSNLVLDERLWQIALNNNQEVKFGFGLVSRFGRPIIFRAIDGAGNYSLNYLETVIIIEDNEAPSVVDIGSLEYRVDTRSDSKTNGNYIKQVSYYKVNEELRNDRCESDNKYYKLVGENNYETVNCSNLDDHTQYYVKTEEYVSVKDGENKIDGTIYYVRDYESLKTSEGKYNLTNKNIVVRFSEPIYKLTCTYYSSLTGEEKDCVVDATEFDYREEKYEFEFIVEDEGDYFVNYTLTVYDFFDNQTTINYLFIDRQKPVISFYDYLKSEDRIEVNYTNADEIESKYNTSYITTGYKNEVKSTDGIESRIETQNAKNYINTNFNYNVIYYSYNFNLTYENYVKSGSNFTKVSDGITKDPDVTYYTLMKKVDGYVFRDGVCFDSSNSNYCYVEDYYNYYPGLLTDSSYWSEMLEDDYGNVSIKNNKVSVYKVEYKVTDIAGNVSDTLIKTVYIVDTRAPEFNINGNVIEELSGYYNKVQILFEHENEGIYQVYYCTGSPTLCTLPSQIFDKATGNQQTESKYITDIGGGYNYSGQDQGTYKFYVYDKGNYTENKICTDESDCENSSLNVMYLKYNYASHQFVIDTEIPNLYIDAEIDDSTNNLLYRLYLNEDAKLYCKQGTLRGEINSSTPYINCEEILNGSYKKEKTSKGYKYIKVDYNGNAVYEIEYEKVSPTADKYFFVTYYKENAVGGFSEYPMGYNFTTDDINNVYKIASITAYIREDGAYEIMAEDKATNQTGRMVNGTYETSSRIDVDNTAPSYNKNQNNPTGVSYWFSVPVDVVNISNSSTITKLLNLVSSTNGTININDVNELNSNAFYAFATISEAQSYLYKIYGDHIEKNITKCDSTKYCYSYYDIESQTFINGKFNTKAEATSKVSEYLSKLVFATYGGDRLFESNSINQRVCDMANIDACADTNMYKYVYLVKNSNENLVSISETCVVEAGIECIKIPVQILNYSASLSLDVEIKGENSGDTEYVNYYYLFMNSMSSTQKIYKEETFNVKLNSGTYYVFEEVDKQITYTNSSDNNHVTHNNKSYYAIFVDDNSYLTVNSKYKTGEITSGYEEIAIGDNGNSNTIKTNADEYYLILKDNNINRFEQKYEIVKYGEEIYSYLRLSRIVQTEYLTKERTFENINDYIKRDGDSYYFEIPIGIMVDDNMIVTIELIDRAGNTTRIVVSKSKQAPNIDLVYLGEGSNQYALVSVTDTWNTATLTNYEGLRVLWSKDGNSYETNSDILNSLKCIKGTQNLKYGCINTGAINGKNTYNVKISNIDYTYGFFKIYLKDDHGNENEIEFIYNPLDFSIKYSTNESETIKYIDNNTFNEEEQRMITKGNLELTWNDKINYINLYKINEDDVWQIVCSSKNTQAGHSSLCSENGNAENKIEANFDAGVYSNTKLTYVEEGIYKVELVNRESILIQNKCIDGDNVYCKNIYTDVSNYYSWEINEEECVKALQIKKEETSNTNSNREYKLFEIDKTKPTTEGVNIVVSKPSGNITFDTIEAFIYDIRSYTNSEVTIGWDEDLVVLKWACNYNISYTIKEKKGKMVVAWVDNGSEMYAEINSNSFTIGQTYYTITTNASAEVVTWSNGETTNSVPITQNSDGAKTFKLLSPCGTSQTLFNEEKIKKFGIDSKNDVIYTFYFEDFAGNINESSDYTFTINIKLPEIEIYEVDENGNKLIDENGNELLIPNEGKVKNNVKLFCYEDSIITECTDAYVVELQVWTSNGYTKQNTDIMVKETYGRTSKYKYSVYVKKDGNGNYYPSLYSEIEFTIDKQPPKIIVNGSSTGEYNYYKGEVIVSLDDTVNGTGYIYSNCVLIDDNYMCDTNSKITFSESPYTLVKTGTYMIVAQDEIGNVTKGNDIKYITIDNDAPEISVVADTTYVQYELAENSYTNAKIIQVNSVDNNPGSYLKYRINDGEWVIVENSSIQFTEEGIYEIKAFDTVGNESIERHFIIYRQKPKYQLIIKDQQAKIGEIIKDDVYLTWKEPTDKAEAPIVKVTLNGENYTKKQLVTETGEYVFVLTDLAGNVSTYKIIINKSDKVCLNNYSIVPKKQYLLEINNMNLVLSGGESYEYKANDTLIFALPTNMYSVSSKCGEGLLGYRALDSNAYLTLSEAEATYINSHVEVSMTLRKEYSEIIAKSDGYIYVFVVDKKVARNDLGMNIGESMFTKDPLGWTLIILAGFAVIYGFGKVVIFRKKVKVLK